MSLLILLNFYDAHLIIELIMNLLLIFTESQKIHLTKTFAFLKIEAKKTKMLGFIYFL